MLLCFSTFAATVLLLAAVNYTQLNKLLTLFFSFSGETQEKPSMTCPLFYEHVHRARSREPRLTHSASVVSDYGVTVALVGSQEGSGSVC